jgi:hypothetical protein
VSLFWAKEEAANGKLITDARAATIIFFFI